MPASEVLKEFRQGTLRSGSKHGPVVTNPKQALAIQISEARKEGYDIPQKPPQSKSGKRSSDGKGHYSGH
jgi:hypothetical protein